LDRDKGSHREEGEVRDSSGRNKCRKVGKGIECDENTDEEREEEIESTGRVRRRLGRESREVVLSKEE